MTLLSRLVTLDQKERSEYQVFVQTKANGDWDKGAVLYANYKNRNPDDIFGEKKRLLSFAKMKFDFNTFSNSDWNNYWLLSQHCDFDINFQQHALSNIEKHKGQDSKEYKYLYDRISCSLSGTQKFGTQSICEVDFRHN
jgi:hypothetical protein